MSLSRSSEEVASLDRKVSARPPWAAASPISMPLAALPGSAVSSTTESGPGPASMNDLISMLQAENDRLKLENHLLKEKSASQFLSVEQEEEFITNKLLNYISNLKKEKGVIVQQMEQEEEYLTNTLQRRLSELQREKVQLENTLEQEQDFLANQFATILPLAPMSTSCSSENKSPLLYPLSSPSSSSCSMSFPGTSMSSCALPGGHVPKTAPAPPLPQFSHHRRHDSSSSLSSIEFGLSPPQSASISFNRAAASPDLSMHPPLPAAPQLSPLNTSSTVEALRVTLNTLNLRLLNTDRQAQKRIKELEEENARLRGEVFLLRQRLLIHSQKLGEMNNEKEMLMNAVEMNSEKAFNLSPEMVAASSSRPLLRRTQSLRSMDKTSLFFSSPTLSPIVSNSSLRRTGSQSVHVAGSYPSLLKSVKDESGHMEETSKISPLRPTGSGRSSSIQHHRTRSTPSYLASTKSTN